MASVPYIPGLDTLRKQQQQRYASYGEMTPARWRDNSVVIFPDITPATTVIDVPDLLTPEEEQQENDQGVSTAFPNPDNLNYNYTPQNYNLGQIAINKGLTQPNVLMNYPGVSSNVQQYQYPQSRYDQPSSYNTQRIGELFTQMEERNLLAGLNVAQQKNIVVQIKQTASKIVDSRQADMIREQYKRQIENMAERNKQTGQVATELYNKVPEPVKTFVKRTLPTQEQLQTWSDERSPLPPVVVLSTISNALKGAQQQLVNKEQEDLANVATTLQQEGIQTIGYDEQGNEAYMPIVYEEYNKQNQFYTKSKYGEPQLNLESPATRRGIAISVLGGAEWLVRPPETLQEAGIKAALVAAPGLLGLATKTAPLITGTAVAGGDIYFGGEGIKQIKQSYNEQTLLPSERAGLLGSALLNILGAAGTSYSVLNKSKGLVSSLTRGKDFTELPMPSYQDYPAEKGRISARWMITAEDTGRTIVVEEKNSKILSTFGGKVDEGENVLQGAYRELSEEAGKKIMNYNKKTGELISTPLTNIREIERVASAKQTDYVFGATVKSEKEFNKLLKAGSDVSKGKWVSLDTGVLSNSYLGRTQSNVLGPQTLWGKITGRKQGTIVEADTAVILTRARAVEKINTEIKSLSPAEKENLYNTAKDWWETTFVKDKRQAAYKYSVEQATKEEIIKDYLLSQQGLTKTNLGYGLASETFMIGESPRFLSRRVPSREEMGWQDRLFGRKPGTFVKFNENAGFILSGPSRYDIKKGFAKSFVNPVFQEVSGKKIVFDLDNTLIGSKGNIRPGVIDFITDLKSRGNEVSIWTHSTRARTEKLMEQTGLNKLGFTDVVTREDYALTSGLGENTLKNIKKISGDVLVDNRMFNVNAANKAGIKAIKISSYKRGESSAFNYLNIGTQISKNNKEQLLVRGSPEQVRGVKTSLGGTQTFEVLEAQRGSGYYLAPPLTPEIISPGYLATNYLGFITKPSEFSYGLGFGKRKTIQYAKEQINLPGESGVMLTRKALRGQGKSSSELEVIYPVGTKIEILGTKQTTINRELVNVQKIKMAQEETATTNLGTLNIESSSYALPGNEVNILSKIKINKEDTYYEPNTVTSNLESGYNPTATTTYVLPKMPGYITSSFVGYTTPKSPGYVTPRIEYNMLPGSNYKVPKGTDYLLPKEPGYKLPKAPGYKLPKAPGYTPIKIPGYKIPPGPGYTLPKPPRYVLPKNPYGYSSTKVQKGKTNRAFQTLVRRKGKWFKIGKLTTKGRALQTGAEFATKTLGASFKIEPTKYSTSMKDVEFNVPSKIFRTAKKERGVFVQRGGAEITFEPGARLASRSEIKEFKMLRNKPKGGWI